MAEVGKTWSEVDSDSSGGGGADLQDPRLNEWKIQKRNGFRKDREDKEKKLKLSKTAKRNSKAPMSDINNVDYQ